MTTVPTIEDEQARAVLLVEIHDHPERVRASQNDGPSLVALVAAGLVEVQGDALHLTAAGLERVELLKNPPDPEA